MVEYGNWLRPLRSSSQRFARALDDDPEKTRVLPEPMAHELFAERDLLHQLQTLVSRQGTPISDLGHMRARHAHLKATMEAPPECPEDWGAIRVYPETVELWCEAEDRLHDRWLYERGAGKWRITRLAP
jgi:pyridoxamine 5'-phosphate oxidase